MTPKLVIFDCDGVLVDTEPTTDRVLSANLARHGLVMSPHEVGKLFVGGTIAGVGEEARRRGAAIPEDWVDGVYAEMFAALEKGVPVIPGVVELLDQLDVAGIPYAIASNGPMGKMRITLPPANLWDRFEGRIYSGHEFGPKPAPDMIRRIMADAGVQPAETVMIDDSANGCRAAQNAGVRCLGYLDGRSVDTLAGTRAEPFRRMTDVPKLIGLAPRG